MIGSLDVRCNAAKPNFPLQPLFAFKGSPSSLRVMDVPKAISDWTITTVKLVVTYPSNTTIEKAAVRTGSVWVATVEGSANAGKVANGYEIVADGVDEDGNQVTGYVLGKGDVVIMDNDTEIARLVGKTAVRYLDEPPAQPALGDMLYIGGQLSLFDGTQWVKIPTGDHPTVNNSTVTLTENGTPIGSFTLNAPSASSIDIPMPTRNSELENDSGFITMSAVPSKVSELDNDTGFITASAVPTKVSELENDSGYLSAVSWSIVEDKPAIPSTTSDLVNDSGFITASVVPTKVSELENDAGYITASAIPSIPSKTSDLLNDSGFITASAIPSNVSEFNNDAGYVTASAIPSNVSQLNNDSGYVTASVVAASYYNKTEINASMSEKRGLYDMEVYAQDVTTAPYYDVVVVYTDTETEKMAVRLVKQNGSTTTWLWQSGGEQIQLTYSNSAFTLTYEDLTDLSDEPQDGTFQDISLTDPTQSVTVGDSYFRFTLKAYGGAIATEDYAASVIPSNITAFNNDAGYITASAIPENVGTFKNDIGYVVDTWVATTSTTSIGTRELKYSATYPYTWSVSWNGSGWGWSTYKETLSWASNVWTLTYSYSSGGASATYTGTASGALTATSLSITTTSGSSSLAFTLTRQSWKDYVDGKIGDINSALDTINGEVI